MDELSPKKKCKKNYVNRYMTSNADNNTVIHKHYVRTQSFMLTQIAYVKIINLLTQSFVHTVESRLAITAITRPSCQPDRLLAVSR